jgi:hypothetical protein
MKVALLITGQLRTYELCKHVVKHCEIFIDFYFLKYKIIQK